MKLGWGRANAELFLLGILAATLSACGPSMAPAPGLLHDDLPSVQGGGHGQPSPSGSSGESSGGALPGANPTPPVSSTPVPMATPQPTATPVSSLRIDHGMVTLTFDDNPGSQRAAITALNAAGVKATFYVCPDWIGQSGNMNLQEIKNLAASGHEVGSHTFSHPDLTGLSGSALDREVRQSKSAMEMMGFVIKTFAYPFCAMNNTVLSSVKSAGYGAARNCGGGLNGSNTNPLALNSDALVSSTAWASVKNNIDQAYSRNGWYIILMHDVNASGEYNTPLSLIQQTIDYVKSKGMPFVTVADGMGLMKQLGAQ